MRHGAAMQHRCATCGDWTHKAEGRILEYLANGRTLCDGCGRFQVYCPCAAAYAAGDGVSVTQPDETARLQLTPVEAGRLVPRGVSA